ncbi:uncharacterized protein LOC131944695 [Physella acuta]|uniref:uncharacterized protein LOC131944695 n=1 Tax=Physella acuta TaxID=109671 RepID=UPI0027DD4139|nr:uncharacterized protein LOC131944695 [Physella acuta]
MRPKIQLRVVRDQIEYLEDYLHKTEPAVGILKDAISQSKAWLEDENFPTSYTEISHQLEMATSVVLEHKSNILSHEREETYDEQSKSTTKAETQGTEKHFPSMNEFEKQVQQSTADLSDKLEQRVERLETTLTFLKVGIKKTEDDVTEIKQWSETYTTEQIEIRKQIEHLAIKQKHAMHKAN